MYKVNPLTVGPILGETTATRVRIFARANKPSGDLKAHVAVELIDDSSSVVKVGKASQDFDFTCITIFENLSPKTKYKYRAGYFFSALDTDVINANINLFN